MDRTWIDKWYKWSDSDAFSLARRIIKEEGLLVGASSGWALWGALQEAKELDEDKRIVIILPDSIRNYEDIQTKNIYINIYNNLTK